MDLFPANTQQAREASATFLTTLLSSIQKWCYWFGDQWVEYETLYRDLLQEGVVFPPMEAGPVRVSLGEKQQALLANRGKKCPLSFLFVVCYQQKTYFLQQDGGVRVAAALQSYRTLLIEELKEVDRMDPQTADRMMEGLETLDATLALQPVVEQRVEEPVQREDRKGGEEREEGWKKGESSPQEGGVKEQGVSDLLDFSSADMQQAVKASPHRPVLDIAFQSAASLAFDLPEPPAQPLCEEIDSEGEDQLAPALPEVPLPSLSPPDFAAYTEEFVRCTHS